jgi:4'-phosphopantetheinyl transferase
MRRGAEVDSGDVDVWVASLDPSALEVEAFGRTLAPDEHGRALQYCFDDVRRRFIARRGLRRAILATYTDTAPARLRFEIGSAGKPELAGTCTDDQAVRFSCSHSRDVAVVAVTAGRGVGVDVERVRPVRDAVAIARTLFGPAEGALLAAVPTDERDGAFLGRWTQLEARLKVSGDGLTGALVGGEATGHSSVQDFTPAPGYVGAVAAEGSGWVVRRREW